jgi:hypothetical protein
MFMDEDKLNKLKLALINNTGIFFESGVADSLRDTQRYIVNREYPYEHADKESFSGNVDILATGIGEKPSYVLLSNVSENMSQISLGFLRQTMQPIGLIIRI